MASSKGSGEPLHMGRLTRAICYMHTQNMYLDEDLHQNLDL